MKRSTPGEQGSPIDLPLAPAPQTPGRPGLEQLQSELPLEPADVDDQSVAHVAKIDVDDRQPESTRVTPSRRVAGAVLDLTVHFGLLAVAAAGSLWLGVSLSSSSWLPLLLLVGCFSFVYHVLPLTFWGHTPGMARVGLVARSLGGGPLTIAQAILRWLGALLSVATLGLLFALASKRSLSDRLSGSAVQG